MGYAADWIISDLTDQIKSVYCAANNGVMYASTNYNNPIDEKGIIAKSTDFGHTWSEVQDDVGQFDAVVCSANGQYVYSDAFLDGVSHYGIYKSVDGGATWSFIDLHPYNPNCICCSSSGEHVYYLTSTAEGATVYKSSYGESPVAIFSDVESGIANINCNEDGSVIVATNNILVSPVNESGVILTNYGASSSIIEDIGISESTDQDSLISSDGQSIMIADYDTGVVKITTNQGASWSTIATPGVVTEISATPDFSRIVFGLDNGDLYASADNGLSWETVTAPAGPDFIYNISQTSDGAFLIMTNDVTGVYYSTTFVVDSITPATGSTAGGTPVTVEGLGFDPAATAAIDGNDLTDITVVDSTTITGITPAGTAGAQDVVVTNP